MYDGKRLDIVNHMKYLGIVFNQSGNIFMTKKHSYDQAQKAMFALLRTARQKSLPIHVVLQLFQTTVLPILLYGCEIWGYENLNILEKLQLKFLKYLFCLNKRTMSHLIYGETGIYPVSVLVKSRMVRFWADLVLPSSKEKYSSIMYDILFTLFKNDIYRSPWIVYVKNILTECGFDSVWERQSFIDKKLFCKNVQKEIENEFERS